VAEIKDRFGEFRTVVVDLEDEAPPLSIAGCETVRVEGPRQWLRFRRSEVSAASVVAAVAAAARVRDLAIEEPDIEDVVTRIYTESP
jgi:ABC-2 type transport system ATP-binding protein